MIQSALGKMPLTTIRHLKTMRTSNHNHNLLKEGKAAETIYDLIRGLAST